MVGADLDDLSMVWNLVDFDDLRRFIEMMYIHDLSR